MKKLLLGIGASIMSWSMLDAMCYETEILQLQEGLRAQRAILEEQNKLFRGHLAYLEEELKQNLCNRKRVQENQQDIKVKIDCLREDEQKRDLCKKLAWGTLGTAVVSSLLLPALSELFICYGCGIPPS